MDGYKWSEAYAPLRMKGVNKSQQDRQGLPKEYIQGFCRFISDREHKRKKENQVKAMKIQAKFGFLCSINLFSTVPLH